MSRRYSLVQIIGTGVPGDAFRPNVSGSFVWVADRAGWVLVKQPIADGTAADATTVADLDVSVDGIQADDVTATVLTAGQKTAIKNKLTAAGFDISKLAATDADDRRQLFKALLVKLLQWDPGDLRRVLTGFDAT